MMSGTMRKAGLRRLLCVTVCLAVVAMALGCSQTQTEWGTGIGAATGATAGYLLAGDDSGLEGALIGGAVGAGSGYLIGSHLEKSEQQRIMQEYNRLIQTNDKAQVNQGINALGDSVLGNSDGHTSATERNQALSQMEFALDTAADEAGNRDGDTSSMERNRYLQKHKDKPLIQVLTGQ